MSARDRGIEIDVRGVPKPGGGVRLLTILGQREARLYDDVVSVLSPRVLEGRDLGVHGVALSPFQLAASRRAWRHDVARIAASGRAVYSDVRACYPSIGPPAVDAGLRAAGVHPHDAARLHAFLREVARAGVPGLPVGPAPSGIVAEAVLAFGDRAVRRAGGSIVRWVDDVVITGSDRATAIRAFDAWTAALRGVGLEPHDGKTDLTGGVHEGSFGSRAVSRGMMRAP